MANFLKSLFGGKAESPETEKEKNNKKNFELFKFDGMRAQRMGQMDYAIKCYEKALAIDREFETISYLSQVHLQLGHLEESMQLLKEMAELDPKLIETFLSLSAVCFMLEDYPTMKEYAAHAIAIDAENPMGYFYQAKAEHGLKDEFNAIAHLTQAIQKKEDYAEAYLMRAEILTNMQQYSEAIHDTETILSNMPEDENALLLHGKLKNLTGDSESAYKDYTAVIELNPFNEQAQLQLGELFIETQQFDKAIALLDEAIETNPNFAQAYLMRGQAKLQKGDKNGSLEDMKKSLELNPDAETDISGQFNNFKDLYANIPL